MTWCKYDFLINDENYTAIFNNWFEGNQFIKDNIAEGNEIIAIGFDVLTLADMLKLLEHPVLNGFNDYDYIIELIGSQVLNNYKNYPKTWMIEAELKRLGYIK